MKTKEFIEEVELLGLGVINYDLENILFIGDTRRHYFSLSSVERYKFEVFNNNLEALEEDTRHKLLDLVVEYSKTPIEERGESKKYYLSLPELLMRDFSYLNLNTYTGVYSFAGKEDGAGYKTKFTQAEIDKLPNQEVVKVLTKEEAEE